MEPKGTLDATREARARAIEQLRDARARAVQRRQNDDFWGEMRQLPAETPPASPILPLMDPSTQWLYAAMASVAVGVSQMLVSRHGLFESLPDGVGIAAAMGLMTALMQVASSAAEQRGSRLGFLPTTLWWPITVAAVVGGASYGRCLGLAPAAAAVGWAVPAICAFTVALLLSKAIESNAERQLQASHSETQRRQLELQLGARHEHLNGLEASLRVSEANEVGFHFSCGASEPVNGKSNGRGGNNEHEIPNFDA